MAAAGDLGQHPVRPASSGVWRHLLLHFPPWSTVHRWFPRLSKEGVFERLAPALTLIDRKRAGREVSPAGAILNAQAARSSGVGVGVKGERSYDPARRVVGRKRHALTDTEGRLLLATVSTADRTTATPGLHYRRRPGGSDRFLAHCFADQAHQGERVGDAIAITVEIVRPDKGQKGFAVQPRRWVSRAPSDGSPDAAGSLEITKRHRLPHSPSSSSQQP